MARITMTQDFDWRVPEAKSPTIIALKAGETYTVKRQCADEATAAGAAKDASGGQTGALSPQHGCDSDPR